MRYLDLSFAAPADNLACDEALLQWCERQGGDAILRIWESNAYFVVAGQSNKISTEVNESACAADGIPIFRRCSGGGTVLQGPGCLNYALILDRRKQPELGEISQTYRFVLDAHRSLFTELSGVAVALAGSSDLAIDGRKFSGNSQYRKRNWILIHGTFLLDFELARIQRYLRMPSKEPAYREHRAHGDFLRTVNLSAGGVKEALRETWRAAEPLQDAPLELVEQLARERYRRRQWNHKF
jgi:lipoate-protein ligase A